METLPDILAPNLDLLIVGFNPSLISWQKGHHYANPVNNFYRLLYDAGLTPRLLKPEEDALLPQYGIGLTNLVVDTPSATEGQVSSAQYRAGRDALRAKVESLKPLVVAFNGIKLYRYYFGTQPEQLGLQAAEIAGSRVFVTPSSSGAANKYIHERRRLYRQLKETIDELKTGD